MDKPVFGQEGYNRGESNPAYTGSVKYGTVHDWVRRRKIKPDLCERCNQQPPRDLANISGLYKRDLDDYLYLCRRCHMDLDGRSETLRESGRSRKIPNKICLTCNKEFHRDNKEAKYCSRSCWFSRRKEKVQ